MANATPASEAEVGKFTEGTKVLISFGAAYGGFEFALALRYSIYQRFAKSPQLDPGFVYLDAVTLESATETTYTYERSQDTFRMANVNWDQFYPAAMQRCKTMIFLLSQYWLNSQWCWKELTWFVENFKTAPIKAVFVVFPDATAVLQQRQITTRQGGTAYPQRLWEAIQMSQATKIYVSSVADRAVRDVSFNPLGPMNRNEQPGVLHFRYAVTEAENERILKEVVVS
jgi:hypothetical protein